MPQTSTQRAHESQVQVWHLHWNCQWRPSEAHPCHQVVWCWEISVSGCPWKIWWGMSSLEKQWNVDLRLLDSAVADISWGVAFLEISCINPVNGIWDSLKIKVRSFALCTKRHWSQPGILLIRSQKEMLLLLPNVYWNKYNLQRNFRQLQRVANARALYAAHHFWVWRQLTSAARTCARAISLTSQTQGIRFPSLPSTKFVTVWTETASVLEDKTGPAQTHCNIEYYPWVHTPWLSMKWAPIFKEFQQCIVGRIQGSSAGSQHSVGWPRTNVGFMTASSNPVLFDNSQAACSAKVCESVPQEMRENSV